MAADPQPYEVTLKPTGNTALDQALHDASQLDVAAEKAPVGPFALVTRARDDAGRFQTALHSFGYYKAKVTLTIDGKPLEDPSSARSAGARRPPNRRSRWRQLRPRDRNSIWARSTIDGDVPPMRRATQLGLYCRVHLRVAADVLTAQQRLLTAIREAGYPLAKVDLPPVTLRPADNLLDVTFHVDDRTPRQYRRDRRSPA